jgi:DNA processing protein
LNFEPTLWSFPQRNRLIAGISDYLFVPEAKEKSGSLITVDFAIKFKKQVFIAPNTLFAPNGT